VNYIIFRFVLFCHSGSSERVRKYLDLGAELSAEIAFPFISI
jgi:hypothetical protein